MGGTAKLGSYVGHWSVQKLGVGGSEGRQGGGGEGEGGGALGLAFMYQWLVSVKCVAGVGAW